MKTKISLLLLVAFFASISLNAQGTLKGVVKDESGFPFPMAFVRVMQGSDFIAGAAVTDFDGMYTIKPLKPGKYNIVISTVGYITQTIKDFPIAASGSTTAPEVILRPDTIIRDIEIIDYKVKIIEGVRKQVSPNSSNYSIYDNEDNESYSDIVENRFKSPKSEPLSTFSVDVDAASYSNIRRFINKGQKPPKDALRTEELINYFSYNYPQPSGNDPVKITTEVGECPWQKEHRLVRIGIKAKEIPSENLPATNFVFLIDVSGSMEGATRLELVKSSLKLLVNNLREKDKVAIVVYAGAAGEALPSTSGNDKQKIKEALGNLRAGGSTAGGDGIQLAYKIAKENFIKEGNNRIILCTDGDFNVGVSDDRGLEKLIEDERKSGVYLTVLGYGMGNYKDKKMQILAEKGNGNHAYIDNLQEANKILVQEFGSTIYTVAKDVKLQIEFNPAKVQSYRLVGYESRLLNKEDFNDDTKDAGEMGAGHTVTAFYEVIPVGVKGTIPGTVDDLKYQKEDDKKSSNTTDSPELLTVKLRYKLPKKNNSEKIEIPLIDNSVNNISEDFQFASAVAMFGQILRGSDFVGKATYDDVISIAKKSTGKDEQGYRKEFVRLVESTKGLE